MKFPAVSVVITQGLRGEKPVTTRLTYVRNKFTLYNNRVQM